ncbi:hypothetical protein [Streptomyces sp. SID3343]|uniref:hypothetical protein n=1 Tax=Streptomyces sp. SID3343 TaxID=2690260 RepID=UPI00136D44F8|nr:hypothetical protein [Streptomyces sp. SID3343]MYW00213.1 hypothetical protein [Streptomyces sp. SID3343]
MTTPTITAPVILAPTGDPTPVEKAVVDGVATDAAPETLLWFAFRRPDGGSRVWYAWTAGGDVLGDRVDRLALETGLHGADWLVITGDHADVAERGRVLITTYPLRPILADVQAGRRDPGAAGASLRRFLNEYTHRTGQPAVPETARMPRWLGVGPTLLAPAR